MAVCSICGHRNRPGVVYCEACSKPLTTFDGLATRRINNPFKVPTLRRPTGTDFFDDDSQLVIHILNEDTPLVITPKERMILGRGADIDLSEFDALKKGVSRIHARIDLQINTLIITDMGSINGTHLNNEQIPANEYRILHDGDEIRLGKLSLKIYFRHPNQT